MNSAILCKGIIYVIHLIEAPRRFKASTSPRITLLPVMSVMLAILLRNDSLVSDLGNLRLSSAMQILYIFHATTCLVG